jgi:hypothetical protein
MNKLLISLLFILGLSTQAQSFKATADCNGQVRTKENNQILGNQDSGSIIIDIYKNTVVVEWNDNQYDFTIVSKEENSDIVNIISSDGEQTAKLILGDHTIELEVGDLIYTTYLDF